MGCGSWHPLRQVTSESKAGAATSLTTEPQKSQVVASVMLVTQLSRLMGERTMQQVNTGRQGSIILSPLYVAGASFTNSFLSSGVALYPRPDPTPAISKSGVSAGLPGPSTHPFIKLFRGVSLFRALGSQSRPCPC